MIGCELFRSEKVGFNRTTNFEISRIVRKIRLVENRLYKRVFLSKEDIVLKEDKTFVKERFCLKKTLHYYKEDKTFIK